MGGGSAMRHVVGMASCSRVLSTASRSMGKYQAYNRLVRSSMRAMCTLEADPVRGVRIKPDVIPENNPPLRTPGTWTAQGEFDSAAEEDPFPTGFAGSGAGSGPSDDVYGEWGLDREIPWFNRWEALGMWLGGFALFGVIGSLALSHGASSPAAPRVTEDETK